MKAHCGRKNRDRRKCRLRKQSSASGQKRKNKPSVWIKKESLFFCDQIRVMPFGKDELETGVNQEIELGTITKSLMITILEMMVTVIVMMVIRVEK